MINLGALTRTLTFHSLWKGRRPLEPILVCNIQKGWGAGGVFRNKGNQWWGYSWLEELFFVLVCTWRQGIETQKCPRLCRLKAAVTVSVVFSPHPSQIPTPWCVCGNPSAAFSTLGLVYPGFFCSLMGIIEGRVPGFSMPGTGMCHLWGLHFN